MRFLTLLIWFATVPLGAQALPDGLHREPPVQHFPTEYLMGPMAHGDHGSHTTAPYLDRAVRLVWCPEIPIVGVGVCMNVVEMVRPIGRLFSRKQETLKGFGSGFSRAGMPPRPNELGTHTHAPTRNLAVEELDRELKKAQQVKLSVSCPNGMKIEVTVDAVNAAATIKSAAGACPAEQLAKKD